MAHPPVDEKLWHLQHCPLFAGVGEREMRELGEITVMVKLEPQERILSVHQEQRAIWMIKEGLVSLTYGDAEGKDATVMLLGAGDLFGSLTEGDGSEYGESVVALKPTVLCRMTQEQMEGLLSRYPETAYRVTKFSWLRIARLQQRLAEIMTKSVKQRLATLLLQLAADYGSDRDDGSRSLGLTVTHDDLARLVGSSREMVSKVMGFYREMNWIHSSRKSIYLLDLGSLQALANTPDETR